MREGGTWAESEEQGPELWQVVGVSQREGRELCLPQRPPGGFPYRVSWETHSTH